MMDYRTIVMVQVRNNLLEQFRYCSSIQLTMPCLMRSVVITGTMEHITDNKKTMACNIVKKMFGECQYESSTRKTY